MVWYGNIFINIWRKIKYLYLYKLFAVNSTVYKSRKYSRLKLFICILLFLIF